MTEVCAIINASRETLTGHSVEDTETWTAKQKKGWWNERKALDLRMKNAIEKMESTLGFWRCLLHSTSREDNFRILKACSEEICDQQAKTLSGNCMGLLSAVIGCRKILSPADIQQSLHYLAAAEGITLTSDKINRIVERIQQGDSVDIQDHSEDCDGSPLLHLSKNNLRRMKLSDLQIILEENDENTHGSKSDLIERIMNIRNQEVERLLPHTKRKASTDAYDSQGDSIILILDHRLESFPWESLDVLQTCAVTRMPSLDLILRNNDLHDSMATPQMQGILVDCRRVSFLLNPADDLPATQEHLFPVLQFGKDNFAWNGVVGSVPEEDAFRNMLQNSDVFVYCGHGSGEKYFRREQVLKLPPGQCSAALLFGCSSGKMVREGVFGPRGAVISYLRVGSPAVVGMLWDVTDKDVDLLSIHLLERWLQQGSTNRDHKPLAAALHEARNQCKLRYLNGAAAVCYGLPLYVKSDSTSSVSSSSAVKKRRV